MPVHGGDVVGRPRFGAADPQRGTVQCGQELYLRPEGAVFAGVSRVDFLAPAVGVGTGDTVCLDQHPVQDHVARVLGLDFLQSLVQVRGLLGQDVDTLVRVAVAGGSGDADVACRQYTQSTSRSRRSTSTAWRNGPSAHERRGVPMAQRCAAGSWERNSTTGRGLEYGNTGTDAKPLVQRNMFLADLSLPETLRLWSAPARCARPRPWFTPLREDYFVGKTSLSAKPGRGQKMTQQLFAAVAVPTPEMTALAPALTMADTQTPPQTLAVSAPSAS